MYYGMLMGWNFDHNICVYNNVCSSQSRSQSKAKLNKKQNETKNPKAKQNKTHNETKTKIDQTF